MVPLAIDLTSDESVIAAMADVRERAGSWIASIVHLAAYYDTTGDEHPKYDAVTVQGTRRLLDALKKFEVEQLVFSSTLLVHAPSPDKGVKINEDWPLEPPWAYPRSKAETETLIQDRRGAIKSVILRFAGVYDEDCRAAFIAQQIARIFERLPTAYLFTGDITHGQPYLHRDDLVDAVVRTVDRRAELPDETVLLIGEEETPSYQEMQERIGHLAHGERWRTLSLPKGVTKLGSWVQTEVLAQETDIKPWMVENSDDHYELDISRARELLGWTPRHNLMDTLPEMIKRLKADPTDWYAINRLDPSGVAASGPELEQAEERLRGPLERTMEEVDAAVERHRTLTLWAPLANAALGLWLIVSPFAYGLFDPVAASVPPALGHEIPLPEIRNAWLGVSEIGSGLLILFFALAGMSRRRMWMQWITAAVGVWVLFAPLAFWTTSAAAYAVDTLIGILVVAFAVMIPPTPGISRRALAADDDRPLGWSYSPSAFTQRIPIVALAFVGLFVSRYLAAFQLGHIDGLWDPFFGPGASPASNGSEAVVTSWVSKGFPIADAGLGAFAYALERGRHRRSPPLAHHAVDGAAVRPADNPARRRQRQLHRHPASADWSPVHAVHHPGRGYGRAFALFDRRGPGNVPVPLSRQPCRRAFLADLLARRSGAVRKPDARARPRPLRRRDPLRLRHRRRQLPLDLGRQHGPRDPPDDDAASLRDRTAALLQ